MSIGQHGQIKTDRLRKNYFIISISLDKNLQNIFFKYEEICFPQFYYTTPYILTDTFTVDFFIVWTAEIFSVKYLKWLIIHSDVSITNLYMKSCSDNNKLRWMFF